MNLEALTAQIGPLPAWAWGAIVVGGGVGVYLLVRAQRGGGLAGVLGQNSAGQQPPVDTSQLDPYTGVPYSVEEATNPATGLPAYYGGPGVDPTPAPPTTPTPAPPPATPPPGPTPPTGPTGAPAAPPPTPTPTPQPKAKKAAPRPRVTREKPKPASGSGMRQRGAGPDGDAGSDWHQTQATPYWPRMTDLEANQ